MSIVPKGGVLFMQEEFLDEEIFATLPLWGHIVSWKMLKHIMGNVKSTFFFIKRIMNASEREDFFLIL